MSARFCRAVLALAAVSVGVVLLFSSEAPARGADNRPYGQRLCGDQDFHCLKVGDTVIEREIRTKKGPRIVKRRVLESWAILFPDQREQEIVRKVNRLGIGLRRGMVIAVPNDMAGKTYMDFSPYPAKIDPELAKAQPREKTRQPKPRKAAPRQAAADPPGSTGISQPSLTSLIPIEPSSPANNVHDAADPPPDPVPGEKVLVFDPRLLAWAAYDENGDLVRWGPAAGGQDWCPDIERGCHTRVGTFRVIVKGGRWFTSSTYPVGCGVPDENGKVTGCAPMPWFMGFAPGYGFHASSDVPGKNASHGCVRLFYEDAEWLNKNFVEIGTKVVIRPY